MSDTPFFSTGRIVAIVILTLLGSAIGLYTKARLDASRFEALAHERLQELEAVQDSMRVVRSYNDSLSTRYVAARTALNNRDSLLSIAQNVYDEVRRRGGRITTAGQVIWKPQTVEGGGTVDADSETVFVDPTPGDTLPPLRFTIDEDNGWALMHVGLTIYPTTRKLDYSYTLNMKPSAFRFYTVERPGDDGSQIIELWADVPGDVIKMDSFILPMTNQPAKASVPQYFFVGTRAFTLGREFDFGAEVGVSRRFGPVKADISLGYGFQWQLPYGQIFLSMSL